MRDGATPPTEQGILDDLRNTRGPAEMLAVLTSTRAARDRSFVARLRQDDQTENVDLRDLRQRQARGLARIHDAIDGLTSVTSLDALGRLYSAYNEMVSVAFWPMARAFADDALAAGDVARHAALVGAFAVRENLVARLERVNAITPANAPDEIEPELADPAFHDFLGVLHEALIGAEGDPAASIAAAREYLVTRSRIQAAVRAALSAPPDPDGRIRVRFEGGRHNAGWHHSNPPLDEHLDLIAGEVARGEIEVDAGIRTAIASVDSSSAALRAYWTSYFLEHLLPRIDDARVSEVLRIYRQLEQLSSEPPLARATVILHYGVALSLNWPRLDAPQPLLAEGAALLRETAGTVPAERFRLLRDLHLTSARLFESLASWDVDALESSAEEYAAGLNVQGAAQDREDIGRAEGGLAAVLGRMARRRLIADAFIGNLFEHALSLLDSTSPWNRAIVLMNYASFLMDRVADDRGAHVDRALLLADEALSIANGAAPLSWTTDRHAAMHMTRANALRERKHGDPKERLLEARKALIDGSKLASTGSEISGLLRLNQAFVCQDLARLEPTGGYEQEAARCFDSASIDLASNPLLAAVAGFDGAMSIEDAAAARSQAKEALDRLVEVGATREVATRAFRLGLLFVAEPGPEASSQARELFELSRTSAATLDDDEAVVRALRALADLDVRLACEDYDEESLARAEGLLSDAMTRAEVHWRRQRTIEARLDAQTAALVHGELAWVKARRGAPAGELLRHISLAKNREYLEHTRATSKDADPNAKQAVAKARQAEMVRWRAQREAAPTESVYLRQSSTRDAIEDARLGEALQLGRVEEVDDTYVEKRLSAFFSAHPTALVDDFTVTRWGTLVVRATTDSLDAFCAPLTRSELAGVVDDADGWSTKHRAWLATDIGQEDARSEWRSATESLLAFLQTRLFGPLQAAIGKPAPDADVVFIPGLLAGLPIHAVPIDGQVILQPVRSVAFAPNIARLPSEPATWHAPTTVGLVLCDPAIEGHAKLSASPAEVASLATKFADSGASVVVAASVGNDVGEAALGPARRSGVRIRSERPGVALFAQLLSGADLFVYSGHALRDGLLLVNDEGSLDVMSIDDVLSMDELSARPFVHFSACSTAAEGVEAVDMFVSAA